MSQSDPADTKMVEVPFVESVRDGHGSPELTRYHGSETGSADTSQGEEKSTAAAQATFTDFG